MSILDYVTIIFISLLTTIIFIGYILYSDRKSKEPIYMIILCLVSCLFTICLSLLIGQVILPKLDIISSGFLSFNQASAFKILVLALTEEYSKLLVLYLFVSRNNHFDDIYDGFVYSSLIALSFAAFETVLYVLNEPTLASMKALAFLRGITTVPLHLICGIVMGYYMGLQKFSWGTKYRMLNLIKCLIIPAVVHYIYNYSLTFVISKFNDEYLLIYLLIFIIPFYFLAYFYLKRTIFLNNKFINNEKYKNLMTKEEFNQILLENES